MVLKNYSHIVTKNYSLPNPLIIKNYKKRLDKHYLKGVYISLSPCLLISIEFINFKDICKMSINIHIYIGNSLNS